MHEPTEGAAARLLAAAGTLFARNGFAGTATRELCAAAGVAQPTLYYHFGSKEGLCRALLQRFLGGLRETLAAGLGRELPARELAIDHVWRHLDFANQHAEPWRLTTALYFGAEATTVGFDFDAALQEEFALTMAVAARAAAAGLVQAGREEAFALALKGHVFVRTAAAQKEGRRCTRRDAEQIVGDLIDGFRPAAPMVRRRVAAVARKALLVAAAFGLAGCEKKADDKKKEAEPTAIAAAPIRAREVQQIVEANGTLQAFEEIPLVPKLDGRVASVLVDIGDRVKPGQVLGSFDPTDFLLNVQQAERALKSELAKLGLDKVPGAGFPLDDVPTVRNAKARLENAADRANRLAALAERKVSSQEETDEARGNVRMLTADLDQQKLLARSGLAMAEMRQVELDLARQRLAETKLIAPALPFPLPGVPPEATTFAVSARTATAGMWIRSGSEVGKLALDQALKLRAPVPERFAGDIRPGQKAEVRSAARRDAVEGVVTRVSPVVDPQARAFEIEVAVPNLDLALKPGGFAKVRVRTRVDSQGRTAPLEAVVRFAGIAKVFVVEGDEVRERRVKLGVQERDWIEILDPRFAPGTLVATSGHTLLADGSKVRIRDPEPPAAPAKAAGKPAGVAEARP